MVSLLSKNSFWAKFYDKIRKLGQKHSFSHCQSQTVEKVEAIYILGLTKCLQ
jgi:hypothetical protein